jgi:hypothetical protein
MTGLAFGRAPFVSFLTADLDDFFFLATTTPLNSSDFDAIGKLVVDRKIGMTVAEGLQN